MMGNRLSYQVYQADLPEPERHRWRVGCIDERVVGKSKRWVSELVYAGSSKKTERKIFDAVIINLIQVENVVSRIGLFCGMPRQVDARKMLPSKKNPSVLDLHQPLKSKDFILRSVYSRRQAI